MLQIPQGKPQPGYFKLFVPADQPAGAGEKIECKNPKTNKVTTGIVRFTHTASWFEIPEWLSYDTYGRSLIDIKKALEKQFKSFVGQEEIKILIIEETKNQ
jgi:hypothetical protein